MRPPTGELINYGFDENLVDIEKEAYILGVNSKLPTTVYRPDGEWPDITYEPQAEKYETSGCTIWGGENQTEFFVKGVYGFEPNYDERFSYLHCNVDPTRGANPQNFYESVRHDGLIDNEPMPDTLEEFISKSYLTKERIGKGKLWLSKWNFWHDWLSDTSKETIKGTLPLSPVAISVTAWFRDEDGLYVDNGRQNTHWCVVKGYVKPNDSLTQYQVNEFTVKTLVAKGKIILKVFDTYDYSHKLLHPDHRIAYAKRIYVEPRGDGETEVLVKSGILDKLLAILRRLSDYIGIKIGSNSRKELLEQLRSIIEALKKVIEGIFVSPDVDEDVIFAPPISKDGLVSEMLYAMRDMEGWHSNPPSRSFRNKNPLNLRWSPGWQLAIGKDEKNFAIFRTVEDGFKTGRNMILNAAKGQSKIYKPTDTFYDFFRKYAPVEDSNKPDRYAEYVCKKMGISPKEQIKILV